MHWMKVKAASQSQSLTLMHIQEKWKVWSAFVISLHIQNKTEWMEKMGHAVHFKQNFHFQILQPPSLYAPAPDLPCFAISLLHTNTALHTYTLIPKQLPCQPVPQGPTVSLGLLCLCRGPENGARHQIGGQAWRVGLSAILKMQSASWGGWRAETQQCYSLREKVLKTSRKTINTIQCTTGWITNQTRHDWIIKAMVVCLEFHNLSLDDFT